MSHRGERLAECADGGPEDALTGRRQLPVGGPREAAVRPGGTPEPTGGPRSHWLLVPKSSGEIWSRNSRNFSTSSSCSSGMAMPASSSTVSLP